MRVKFLSSYVDILDMQQTVEQIDQIIEQGIPTQHVVINANKINLMYKDKKLRQIVNDCPLINADGISVVLGHKLLGLPKIERLTGIDLFLRLLTEAEVKGYRIYFLGARSETLSKLEARLKSEHPNLQIAGCHHGYFKRSDSPAIAKKIRESTADIVFVAFSSPEKEYWIHDNLKTMNAGIAIGVGGSFDVYAGVVKRAPLFIQKNGFEWLYRFLQEPRRMFKRYFIGNLVFLRHLYVEKLKK